MKVLITGAKGFVGKNIAEVLKNIRDGKDRTRPNLKIEEIYLYDIDSSKMELETACEKADFVFNLAGVNRPRIVPNLLRVISALRVPCLTPLKGTTINAL